MLRDASSATKSRGPARSPGTLWTTAEDLFGALHRRSDEPPGDIHGGAGEHQAPDRPRMTHEWAAGGGQADGGPATPLGPQSLVDAHPERVFRVAVNQVVRGGLDLPGQRRVGMVEGQPAVSRTAGSSPSMATM